MNCCNNFFKNPCCLFLEYLFSIRLMFSLAKIMQCIFSSVRYIFYKLPPFFCPDHLRFINSCMSGTSDIRA